MLSFVAWNAITTKSVFLREEKLAKADRGNTERRRNIHSAGIGRRALRGSSREIDSRKKTFTAMLELLQNELKLMTGDHEILVIESWFVRCLSSMQPRVEKETGPFGAHSEMLCGKYWNMGLIDV